MSLRVWLPLRGNLENQGLSQVTVTVSGSTMFNTTGKLGQSLTCNGSSFWTIAPVTLGNAATIACWTKTSTGGKMPWVIVANSSNKLNLYQSSQYTLNIGDGNSNLFKDTNGNAINVLSDNLWHHFVVTFDGTVSKLYIDGIYRGTAMTYRDPTTTSAKTIYLGGGYGGGHTYDWNGSINDFRIYDHALSPEEVADIAKGLVLWYPLNSRFCEATTNIVPNSDTFEGWSNYVHGYTAIVNNEFGTKSIVVTDKKSWAGIYCNITLPSPGIYTLSVYCKPIARSSSSIVQSFYFQGGGFTSDQAISADWTKINQWQRISMTKNFTDTSVTVYLIAYGGDRNNDTVSCEWTMPQVEQKDHATPYTSSTRTPTTIYDISGYKNNGTIVGNLAAAAGSPKYDVATVFSNTTINLSSVFLDNTNQCHTVSAWVYPTATTNSTLINFNNGYYLFYGNGGRTLMYLNSGTYNSYVYGNALPVNTWTFVTWVLDTKNLVCTVYYNGVLHANSSNYRSGDIPSGVNKNLTVGYGFSGKISDFRIYATALTAEQVADLYRNSMLVDASGNVTPRGLS